MRGSAPIRERDVPPGRPSVPPRSMTNASEGSRGRVRYDAAGLLRDQVDDGEGGRPKHRERESSFVAEYRSIRFEQIPGHIDGGFGLLPDIQTTLTPVAEERSSSRNGGRGHHGQIAHEARQDVTAVEAVLRVHEQVERGDVGGRHDPRVRNLVAVSNWSRAARRVAGMLVA